MVAKLVVDSSEMGQALGKLDVVLAVQAAHELDCLTVAGDIDYIVLVRSKDVAHYQDFARRMLATAPGIRAYTSEIVLDVPKWTTEVPVEDA